MKILGDPQQVHLSRRIAGDGKWVALNGVAELEEIMCRVVQKAGNAKTKSVGLEVKNTAVSSSALWGKGK